MDFSWAALYANSMTTSRVSMDPEIRRSQAQSRLRSHDAIHRASFLPSLIYSRCPYATCWIARKNRAVKKILSLWRRPGESFVGVFFQLVLTRASHRTVYGVRPYRGRPSTIRKIGLDGTVTVTAVITVYAPTVTYKSRNQHQK